MYDSTMCSLFKAESNGRGKTLIFLFSRLVNKSNKFGIIMLKGASNGVDALCVKLEDVDLTAQNRSVTGVLSSHPDSRDLHIDNLSLLFHGVELLVDAMLELNVGRRYGLIGLNGCGKVFLLVEILSTPLS